MPETPLLSRLNQLDFVDFLVRTSTPEALARPSKSSKWSANQNLAHIGRYHEVMLARIHRILKEDRPALDRYAVENDPEWRSWESLRTEAIVSRLKTLRTQMIILLRSLSPEQVKRRGVHSDFGDMSIPEWIDFFLIHEGHHLYNALLRAKARD